MSEILLRTENLSVRYGAIHAVEEVNIEVHTGEVVTLLGANGAGKTSLLRAISHLEPSAGGSIIFAGAPIHKTPAPKIVGRGLAHCPEGRRVFPSMTIDENLDLGAYLRSNPKEIEATRTRVFSYFPVLGERRKQTAGTLSGGEQQMLAVGRALMSAPKLLMLDEPSLGLAPKYIDQIFNIITRINRENGVTIFLVEQNANEALLHAHRGYVMENGRITLQGDAATLRKDPRVIEAYLGI